MVVIFLSAIELKCLYIVTIVLMIFDGHMMCHVCKGWSKDITGKLQLDKDRYLHSVLRAYEPS